MKKIFSKLDNQIILHNQICDKIMEERFKDDKHDDQWNNDLFCKYKESKIRLKLLLEIFLENQYII